MLVFDSQDFWPTAGSSLAIAAPPPSGARGSPLILPRACLAAARGPGRSGLRRCLQGGMDCPAGDRFWEAEGRLWWITGRDGTVPTKCLFTK